MNVETTMLKIASLYCFCHQVEMNAIVKSIEKELGKNAVLDMYIPGLNTWKMSQSFDIREPNC